MMMMFCGFMMVMFEWLWWFSLAVASDSSQISGWLDTGGSFFLLKTVVLLVEQRYGSS